MTHPAHLWVPPGGRGSYLDEVADVAELMGRPLYASQRVDVEALTTYGARGRWLTLETCIKEPRQNGKTGGVVTPIVLTDFFVWNADRIAWTAHLFKTTRDAFADHVRLIQSVPDFDAKIAKISYSNGEESIKLKSGAILEYLARSKGGGRGLGGKRVVIDEALFFKAEQAGALLPILAARDNPQVMYASSGCKAESDQLRSLTARGRSMSDPSLIWVEYCAPGDFDMPGCLDRTCTHEVGTVGCVLDDEELWAYANPVLMPSQVEFLRAMRRTLPPLEFAREFLGWDERELLDVGVPALDFHQWERVTDRSSGVESVDGFGLDASPDGVFVSIGMTGLRPDGRRHVEHVERRRGFLGLVERCVQLNEKHGPVPFAVEAKGGLKDLILPLREAGLDVRLAAAEDLPTAAKGFVEDLNDGHLVHGPQPELDDAVRAARWRSVGDGISTFGRRRSASDISALYAVTFAHWVAVRLSYDPLESIL